MASRFVSGGRIDAKTGEDVPQSSAVEAESGVQATSSSREGRGSGAGKSSAEWEAVQRELEAERRRRDEARAKAVNEGGEKSLYDILQANKGWFPFFPRRLLHILASGANPHFLSCRSVSCVL